MIIFDGKSIAHKFKVCLFVVDWEFICWLVYSVYWNSLNGSYSINKESVTHCIIDASVIFEYFITVYLLFIIWTIYNNIRLLLCDVLWIIKKTICSQTIMTILADINRQNVFDEDLMRFICKTFLEN